MAADTPVSDAVARFQENGRELALVEENGTVVGMVTTTDAFETVMGDLEDLFDARETSPVEQ